MNLLINLQIFRTNQWFMSAKFFIGRSLIHWRCCVAQLTSFFIASKRELDLFCQLCRPGLSTPTLSSMYCSHHNNMTALFTKRASLRTPQYSRLYSEPSADYIQQEEPKKNKPWSFQSWLDRNCSHNKTDAVWELAAQSDWNVLLPSTRLMAQ